MKNEKRYEKLAIITPSFINSKKRFHLAKKSLESLEATIGAHYEHIVVDDTPPSAILVPKKLRSFFPIFRWNDKSMDIYSKSNITLIRRSGSGSASAVLISVREALKQGKSFGFLHLDDHIYMPNQKKIMEQACDALDHDTTLLMVRFSGYPLIYNNYVPLVCENDQIFFDHVVLHPQRRQDYTLWWSTFTENTVDGNYWPIAMWFCIYRLDFLEKLLSYDPVKKLRHLGHVELFYKNKENWRQFLKGSEGKFGYINMQFGGLEMHRNKNWQDLVKLPNNGIL